MTAALSIAGGLSAYVGLIVAASNFPTHIQGHGWKAVGAGAVAMIGAALASALPF